MQRRLTWYERWMRDGLTVCHVPGYSQTLTVDVSAARAAIDWYRHHGVHVTWTHVFIRAAALALSRNPDLNVMVCGRRVFHDSSVHISVSIAGDSFVAPVLLVEHADRKTLPEIARAVTEGIPATLEQDRAMSRLLNRFGRLIPAGILRRAILRQLFALRCFRQRGTGSLQVSVLSGIDAAASPVFSASAMLVAGRVHDQPIVIDGNVMVRPTVTLTCCSDHRVWDGLAGQRFLKAMELVLSSDHLLVESLSASDSITSVVKHPKS